jgi:hypothetical protein
MAVCMVVFIYRCVALFSHLSDINSFSSFPDKCSEWADPDEKKCIRMTTRGTCNNYESDYNYSSGWAVNATEI